MFYVQTYENERSTVRDIRFENVVSNGALFTKKSLQDGALYALSTQVFDADKELHINEG